MADLLRRMFPVIEAVVLTCTFFVYVVLGGIFLKFYLDSHDIGVTGIVVADVIGVIVLATAYSITPRLYRWIYFGLLMSLVLYVALMPMAFKQHVVQ